MTKSRIEMGEVAYDRIWRDRIKTEEREGRARISTEELEKSLGIQYKGY